MATGLWPTSDSGEIGRERNNMQETTKTDCLSFGDSLFLYLERPGMPLHVAALCIFDGDIPVAKCMRSIWSKLSLVPRYRQKVVQPPFGLGGLRWEYDSTFDIRDHVHDIQLKRGTPSELQQVVSRILSTTLCRNRPLWDFTLISGLKDRKTALLARVHHCLADGISGVELLSMLLDKKPVIRIPRTKLPSIKFSVPRDSASQVLEGVGATWFSALERLLIAESQLIKIGQGIVAETVKQPDDGPSRGQNGNELALLTQGWRSWLAEFGSPPDRLPFNKICNGPQTFAWTELPFRELRVLKHEARASVNDVVLALVALTMHRYARAHRIATAARVLRIVVPVSVRTKSPASGYGNQLTFVPVTIPLGINNPRALLPAIHNRMAIVKKIRLAEIVGLAGTLLGAIPASFQAFAGPIVSQLPLSVCNLICTNVPGPQEPLYLLGHRMLTFYPYVPIGGEMGMNCAVLTYDGTAYFGFTGDVNAISDLNVLPGFLQESFGDLRKAFAVGETYTKGTRIKGVGVATKKKPVIASPSVTVTTVTDAHMREKPMALKLGA